ncbi:hypothetical protein M413DRAFT_446178 [Hebeloma cylindrosporum]|uniref:EH domain-containing protein n=1 Tax=Hebeloma cylindrosporum TaxID=76867 RepID=A0A0C2YIC2_HEBCY|nr:hypothetical protein M413DRAFT_446178 [Hebeloma cylindrosporum h7]
MRRLALHASALSDAEYDLYTTILRDIALADDDNPAGSNGGADDAHFENMNIGVREARAWLRGRYSHLSASTIDKILKLFSPNLGHGDTISGSEFFAALRLVIHAEGGKDVERSLAFVQADPGQPRPSSPARNARTLSRSTSRANSPAKRRPGSPPPSRKTHTDSVSHTDSSSHNPFSVTDHPQPPIHPSHRSEPSKSFTSISQHSAYNPFVHRPPPPRSEDGTGKLPPLPPRKLPPPVPSQPLRHITTRNRPDRSVSPSKFPNMPPPSTHTVGFPTPPPKPPHHVTSTLMRQSLQASKVAQTMKKAEEQLEKERVMQVLKSSSVVSGSYSLAGASVTGSSIVIGTNIHNHRSTSPGRYAVSSASSASDERAPPLPKRRNQPQQPSPPMSASSLEQVALATPPNFPPRTSAIPNVSPFRSPVEPIQPNADSAEHCPPPMHPDRKPYVHYQVPAAASSSTPQRNPNLETFEAIYGPMTASTSISSSLGHGVPPTPESPISTSNSNSPTTRVFRSKSMHQTSPPLPSLPPPLRRKRPESVQVLGSGEVLQGSLTRLESAPSTSSSSSTISRHASLSTSGHRRSSLSISSTTHSNSSSHTESPMSNIQRTIATLQPKLDALQIQPRLDKARYKAEAGLSRRGFVSGGRAKSGVEGEEEEGLVRRPGSSTSGGRTGRGRKPEVNGNIFDDPGVDSDSFDDHGEGGEEWSRSRGMDSSPVRQRQNVFDAERDSLGPGQDDGLRGVEKDNLKWPAGEGWKPL